MWWPDVRPARAPALRPTRRAVLCGAALALGGCGFALRQPRSVPFERIAFIGFAPRSPMEAALRAALPASVHVAATPAPAQLVLRVLDDRTDRTVVASTAAGQVRELRLHVTLKLQLEAPDGRIRLPATLLEQTRDISYTETSALAKETEEAQLLAAMRADLAQQVLRVLATLHADPA